MNTRQQTLHRLALPVLIVLMGGLAACESTPATQATGDPDPVSGNVSGNVSPSESSGADPVARYALSAASGDSAQLRLDSGGQVFVTVGSIYTSAAGIRCRRVTLRTQRDASRVSAVCKQDGSWHTVLKP
jgi:hypothetical protein